jgi:hypothetical protein
MARVAPLIPDPQVLLCERCGYVLSGLPTDQRCPECGDEIARSLPERRGKPAWELSRGRARFAAFFAATLSVLLRPSSFYRGLSVTADPRSEQFSRIHWWITALMMGTAAFIHFRWMSELTSGRGAASGPWWWAALPGLVVGAYASLLLVTYAAAHLTAWEAAYRGLRLPLDVLLRALDYHSVHYLPVALVVLVTVAAYQVALHAHLAEIRSAITYLYLLCGEVIVAAGYLFNTYWIAMRNLMYANR